eukprot:CCRYP_012992-RD/>CCRYP_012992-RD protein AED:0.10 eAED:0.10 QI:78/0.77/0.8/1/0.88/0.9/10/197/1465
MPNKNDNNHLMSSWMDDSPASMQDERCGQCPKDVYGQQVPSVYSNESDANDTFNRNNARISANKTDDVRPPKTGCSNRYPIDHTATSQKSPNKDAPDDEPSPRTRRRQLRELKAASDDCWEANLSDDEDMSKERLPLEWEARMVRRQMNRRKRGDLSGSLGGVPKHDAAHSQHDASFESSNSDALFEDEDVETNNCESGMSLPEQLLRNRLLRKQRIQKKHELFLKYQKQQLTRANQQLSNESPTQHVTRHSRDNFNFLSGSTGSNGRPTSPLFPDDSFDRCDSQTLGDDNVSIVASSNGSTPQPSQYFASPSKQMPHKISSQTPTSPLDSLPHRPIVPLPDEADRKRVVGCLAAILASSYSYETVPHLLVKKKTVGAAHIISKPLPSEENTAHNEEQLWQTHEPMYQQYLSQKQNKQRNSNNFQHAHSTEEIRRSNSFQPPSSKPKLSFQNSFSFSSFNNKFDAGSRNPPSQLTAELAEIRHRIRRHAVLSELLVSSAEMLLLDPSHARAFLPMLEGLLSKKEEKATNQDVKKESWKGRGFGGGGVQTLNSNLHLDGTMSFHGLPSSFRDIQSSPAPRISSSVHGSSPTSHSKSRSSRSSTSAKNSSNLNMTKSEGSLKDEFLSNDAGSITSSHSFEQSTKSLDRSHTSDKAVPVNDRPASPTALSSYSPLDTIIVEKENIAPFLETMTPGAGFRCIALLLLNHLLRDGRGYDARVRHAFKRFAVVILSHELKVGGILRVDLDDEEDLDVLLWGDRETNSSSEERDNFDDVEQLALLATRKFEAMEHAIATKLIAMSGLSNPNSSGKKSQINNHSSSRSPPKQAPNSTHGRIALAPKETPLSSQHAGAVGATLFALTGGLAAPGIAAGLAAVAGGSAVAAGVTTVFSSAAAISTIFGVGGAGLASYKMHRRTKGLTEFDFQKEGMSTSSEAELFSTICISGWLRDSRDFQRPWGVSPSHPRIVDKQELLERFYFVHNPENIERCQTILKHWKGRYFQLWKALHQKYGSDPSNLFPLKEGPRISAELTHEESEAIEFLLNELGYTKETETKKSAQSTHSSKATQERTSPQAEPRRLQAQKASLIKIEIKDSLTAQKGLLESFGVSSPDISTLSSNLSLFEEDVQVNQPDSKEKSTQAEETSSTASNNVLTQPTDPKPDKMPPKHLLTVWDYNANYGGELYTVKWESDLLMELCDSVTDQMIEWGIGTTKTILHTTVFATLMTAVTIPYSLAMASNVIDDTWSMAMERADRAGVELAKSLIDSTAGHRPVVLVGFSMGARVIYSCLKELTRQQELWEDQQQKKGLPSSSGRNRTSIRNQADDKLKFVREPASIIEDAIMMGMPNHVSLKSWEASRRVVAGRLINCYSRKDMILSLMFQLKRMQGILRPVCGTSPVLVDGVENFDVTDLVSAHTDYCLVTGEILKRLRHGQPQKASISKTDVAAMVTTIKVANYGFTPLSDEAGPKK